jgi:MFS family permease
MSKSAMATFSAEPVPLSGRWRWLQNVPRGQFWLYFTAAVFFNIGFSIYYFLFNLYLLGFGFTERSLGLIGSGLAVGSLIGTIPVGILAERFGLRWMLTGGILLTVVFSVLRVCIVTTPAQLALAVCGGAMMSCWGVCLSPAVAGLTTDKQRPFAFSLMFASGIGVSGLGGLAAGRLPGWFRIHSATLSLVQAERMTLLFACGIAALALLLVSNLALPSGAPRKRLVRLTDPFLRRFLIAMAVWSLVTGAFPPFANVYFVHHLGISLQSMGSVFSLSQLVQFVAVLCAPLLLRRTGITAGVMLTQLTTAGMLVALAVTHVPAHAIWLFWGYMAAQFMNEPGIASLLMDKVSPEERNGASSYTFFLSAGAQIIASSAVGAAIVRFGYPIVLYAIAAVAVVAAVLFRRLSHPMQIVV